MNNSALFLMGSVAIFLLGTFHSLLAQTLPVRVPSDPPIVAFAKLHYLFWGVAIFAVAALLELRDAPADHRPSWSKAGFWLMFVGFNLAFFPTTLRRSQAFLTDPVRLFSPAVGPEVNCGAVLLIAGLVLCVFSWADARRSTAA